MRGSVYSRQKDENGNGIGPWSYDVDLGRDPLTNKRRQKTKGGFKTKIEAESALSNHFK